MGTRRSLEESYRVRGLAPLARLGRRPSYSADEGEDFFRSRTTGVDFSHFTMPHLAALRALMEDCRFENSDLSQSLMTWSDFRRVSFADADLHDSDLRNSVFEGCDFSRATLAECDLRGSDFSGCTFAGAALEGARVTAAQLVMLPLDLAQRKAVVVARREDAPGG